MHYPLQKIIDVANELNQTGTTAASTGERIAAAFVLNKMDYLPDDYRDINQAWDYLEVQWQGYVRLIKRDYQHLVKSR